MKNVILIIAFALFYNSADAQVGVGTTDPKSTLDINGNLSIKVVSLNGGPGGSATVVDDGTYINLTPTLGNLEFILPDATLFPGRIYIMRNVDDLYSAVIYSFGFVAGIGNGVEFYAGDSRASSKSVTMTPDTAADGGDVTKTLIFVSDGTNWTYGTLGF